MLFFLSLSAQAAQHVLVRDSAVFYPSRDGKGAHRWESEEARKRRANGVAVFELIEDQGDWLLVESTTDRGAQCEDIMRPDLRLRVWVRRDELALANSQEVTQRWEDGTALTLAPGNLLVPTQRDDTYEVTLGYLRTNVETPHTGHAFEADEEHAVALSKDSVGVKHLAALPWFEARSADEMIAYPAARVGEADEQGRVPMRIEQPCFAIEAQLPQEAVATLGGIVGGATHINAEGLRLRAGADLFWPDGSDAGSTEAEVELLRPWGKKKGRKCYALDLLEDATPPHKPDTIIRICAAEQDVIED